jgi:predicted ester cyclase
MIEQLMEQYIAGGVRAIDTGDWDAYASLYAEDLLMETPGIPGPTRGRDVRLNLAKGLMDAFPDSHIELLRNFGAGEWACFEVLFTGTHKGAMPGPDGTEIPPTNKLVKFPYCMIVKFEDGKCSEIYEYYDQLSLLTQLGIMG